MFLKDGARRFVLEGRECGGHVGPRSSFVLWEAMIEVLLRAHRRRSPADELHVVFAGGIHDARSGGDGRRPGRARWPRGASSRRPDRHRLPVHRRGGRRRRHRRRGSSRKPCAAATRCCSRPAPATRSAAAPRRSPRRSRTRSASSAGRGPHARGESRSAWKAERRPAPRRLQGPRSGRRMSADGSRACSTVAEDGAVRRGMYMIGQVAALRNGVITIADCTTRSAQAAPGCCTRSPPDAERRGRAAAARATSRSSAWPASSRRRRSADVLGEHPRPASTRSPSPADRWDWRLYYDPDPKARDKIISKWGGFLPTSLRPAALRHAAHSLPLDRAAAAVCPEAVRGPSPTPATPIALSPASGRPSSWASAAAAARWPWATPSGPACRCWTRCRAWRSTPSRHAELGRALLPEWTEDSFPGIL